MSRKGSTIATLYHCIFNGAESITHFMHENNAEMLRELPHVYAICIADNSLKPRQLVGGFIAKTSWAYADHSFEYAALKALEVLPGLNKYAGKKSTCLLPVRLGMIGALPLTEVEMTKVMLRQYLRHSAVESA